jgi:hypothetical protein
MIGLFYTLADISEQLRDEGSKRRRGRQRRRRESWLLAPPGGAGLL